MISQFQLGRSDKSNRFFEMVFAILFPIEMLFQNDDKIVEISRKRAIFCSVNVN